MYDGKTQLLIKNPINRYLINSPMLPNMKLDAEGAMTLYIQKEFDRADKESNWLPAPDGPIYPGHALILAQDRAALDSAAR